MKNMFYRLKVPKSLVSTKDNKLKSLYNKVN